MSETNSNPDTIPAPLPATPKPPKPKQSESTVSAALAGLDGLSQQGAGTTVEAALPPNTTVLTMEDSAGTIQIDHTVGTTKSAANKHFLCYTTLEDLGETESRWVLGKITSKATKQGTAKRSAYSTNWHNYTIVRLLSGPTIELPGGIRAINLTLGALWCVLGHLPDDEVPSEGATVAFRQGLESSPMKGAAASKPQPMTSEEDDDDDILEIEDPQGGDNNQSGPQAGPSNIMDLTLDVNVAVKVNPDQLLPTAPGLGSTSESLVPSALSSITTLSTVSNITAINMEIAKNLTGFIQGTLHCQKNVLQWIPFIHNPAVYSPNSQPNKTPLSKKTNHGSPSGYGG